MVVGTYGPVPLGTAIISNAAVCVGDVGGSEVGRFRKNRVLSYHLRGQHLAAISNNANGHFMGVFEAPYREYYEKRNRLGAAHRSKELCLAEYGRNRVQNVTFFHLCHIF